MAAPTRALERENLFKRSLFFFDLQRVAEMRETDPFFFFNYYYYSPSPSPRLSKPTSTRNSVPTRAGANPRSSRLATKRTPSVKSSTADGPNWASPAPGPPRTAPVSRGSPRVPCAPRMTAPPSRTSSRAPSPRWRRKALATRPSGTF